MENPCFIENKNVHRHKKIHENKTISYIHRVGCVGCKISAIIFVSKTVRKTS